MTGIVDDAVAFDRTPGGYTVNFTEVGVLIDVRQVRWEHGSLYGVVSVRTRMQGVKTIGSVVTESRVNLSGDRGRKDVARACDERAPGLDIDWRGMIEDASIRILAAEREGRPFTVVGKLPQRLDPGHTIKPLLPSGRVAFVYGPGGATKGFLAAALCMSVETGIEIVPGLPPAARGRALYLDWESDEYDLDARVKAIARGAGLERIPEIGYRECFGPLTEQVDDIEREIHRSGVTLLVVDSIGMALSVAREGGDANESTIRMFSALRRLNVTTLAIDHVVGAESKAGGKSARPYGSVYKVNLARNTYEIRPLPAAAGDEDWVRHVVIRHRKANMSGYLPDMGYAVRFEDGGVRWVLEEVRQVEDDEADGTMYPTSTRQLIRGLLEQGHMSEEALADETGRKIGTIQRVLSRYSDKAKDPTNRWFAKLPGGRWEALPLGPVDASQGGFGA